MTFRCQDNLLHLKNNVENILTEEKDFFHITEQITFTDMRILL